MGQCEAAPVATLSREFLELAQRLAVACYDDLVRRQNPGGFKSHEGWVPQRPSALRVKDDARETVETFKTPAALGSRRGELNVEGPRRCDAHRRLRHRGDWVIATRSA